MQETCNLVAMAVITACIASFIILLIGKLGLRDLIIAKARVKIFSELFDCDFCLSFWTTLILAGILAIIFGQPIYLLIPLMSTPITRILI